MDQEILIKANSLNDRIERLSLMKRELRPEHCNGVGICGSKKKNDSHKYYQFHLWSTHSNNTEDTDLIMRVGIKAMYDEVCRLLEIAKDEFESIKL